MSDFRPLVSIVIPVFNGSNYMREAVDSALAQTYDNCEVIVVNDGSTDETDRIARFYDDKIRYFAKENGGVATALNLGIREMRGEYFSWLSYDDVYLPNKIERQIAFMKRFELQDAVLYCDHSMIDDKSRHIGDTYHPEVSPDNFFQYLYLKNNLHGCTLLIPRKVFDDTGLFSEDLITTQDYDLWMRMCRVRPFVHQAETLIQGRLHKQQGTITIPAHQVEVTALYQHYLPDLVEISVKNKTPAEAARQRQWLVEQLCQSGLNLQAKEVSGFAESVEERKVLDAIIRRKYLSRRTFRLLWNKILQGIKSPIKKTKKIINSLLKKYLNGGRGVHRLNFRQYYLENAWGATESFSGSGSSLFQTRIIRRELPILLSKLQVHSMLDIPCGDFNWMRRVVMDGIRYIGGDIVLELIERNRNLYNSPMRSFEHLDAVNGPLPVVDLILCRDCFVHLPFVDIQKALRTFKESQAVWLLTTTFTEHAKNDELTAIAWRPLNLCLPPFNLPEPVLLIDEKSTEGGGRFLDKALALWDLRSLVL